MFMKIVIVRSSMRVFITGPFGYVGAPITKAFSMAGHQVRGLVRTEKKANELRKIGVEAILADFTKPKTYLQAIEQAEVIIHTAFAESFHSKAETLFLDALMDAISRLSHSFKTFIYTSGVWVIGNTGKAIADESSDLNPIDLVKWRVAQEARILDAASTKFRPVVIRPGCVYGSSGSLTSLWFESTLQGVVEIIGDGTNHWSMIHQDDLARAYLMVAEQECNNLILNIVDHSHASVMEMAIAISQTAGIPGKVKSLESTSAKEKYEDLAEGLLIDQHISNERAMRLLGWRPQHPSFIDNVDIHYMAWKANRAQG